jgi:hypothetical protein
MTLLPALKMVRDPYYRRLCRDLENRSRRRKINCDRLALVRAVQHCPISVPEGWESITQAELDNAHAMASLIESHLEGDFLYYDYAQRVIRLHGSYGSKQ